MVPIAAFWLMKLGLFGFPSRFWSVTNISIVNLSLDEPWGRTGTKCMTRALAHRALAHRVQVFLSLLPLFC